MKNLPLITIAFSEVLPGKAQILKKKLNPISDAIKCLKHLHPEEKK